MNRIPYGNETFEQKQNQKQHPKKKSKIHKNSTYSNTSKKRQQDLQNSLSFLKDKIVSLSEKQEKLKTSRSDASQIELKMVESVTTFFDRLSGIIGDGGLNLESLDINSKLNNGRFSKEDIMEIVKKLQIKGATFDQITAFLKEHSQSSFSDKNKWNPQSAYDLYKE